MSPRRALRALAVAAAVALLVAAATAWHLWTAPAADPGREVVVRVPRGATLNAVADTLASHGLLGRRGVFVWGARLAGRDRALRAGRYALPSGLSPRDLLARLVAGHTVPVRVTILEGGTAAAIADSLAAAFPWRGAEFLAAADSLVARALPRAGLDGAARERYAAILRRESARAGRVFPLCEGYLFPETYHFAEGVDAAHVAATVLALGDAHWRELLAASPLPADGALAGLHEALTLASIVEAETPRPDEMPRVAAVYLNRLARGIPLEADPTVAHALDKRGERILYADLESDSDFNTYRRRGLPPGPIGSPGAAALRAVLAPEPGFDAFFFVADGRGGHVFSRTLEEHQDAVRRYRRLRDGRGGP